MDQYSSVFPMQFAHYCDYLKRRHTIILTIGKKIRPDSELKEDVILKSECIYANQCDHTEECPVLQQALRRKYYSR